MAHNNQKIETALVSVSDKTGIAEFAAKLAEAGVALLSTGGTAKMLRDAGLEVRDVADITKFPEMMDGRLKTLHPVVHGGLLAVRGNADHEAAQAEHGIGNIDLLCVNLYPFEDTVARGADYATAIENIDIGGPAMIRAAAKNHDAVTVLVDPSDYDRVLDEMRENGGATSFRLRRELAQRAYARTAEYDAHISNYLGTIIDNDEDKPEGLPRTFTVQYKKTQEMRYGENPHQRAAFYTARRDGEASISFGL